MTSNRCRCCGSSRIEKFNGYFFPFICARVFNTEKKDTSLIHCKDCDFYYSEVRFTPDQMTRLYSGYRDKVYQKQRQSFEPDYTEEFNAALGGKLTERARKDGIFSLVNKYCSPEAMKYVLDYGGDHGQFFPEQYEQARRYVYDISKVELVDGVERLTSFDGLRHYPWDLILCCHVLEHLPSPREEIRKIFEIMPVGCYLYIEVPREEYFFPYIEKNNPVPVHEHINFFNKNSLSALFNEESMMIVELNKDDSTYRVLAVKIDEKDMIYKILNHTINKEEQYLKQKIVNIESTCEYINDCDKLMFQEMEHLKNKIVNIESTCDYINRYPRWLVNLLCCFVPKQKNRKYLRRKYSRQ